MVYGVVLVVALLIFLFERRLLSKAAFSFAPRSMADMHWFVFVCFRSSFIHLSIVCFNVRVAALIVGCFWLWLMLLLYITAGPFYRLPTTRSCCGCCLSTVNLTLHSIFCTSLLHSSLQPGCVTFFALAWTVFASRPGIRHGRPSDGPSSISTHSPTRERVQFDRNASQQSTKNATGTITVTPGL